MRAVGGALLCGMVTRNCSWIWRHDEVLQQLERLAVGEGGPTRSKMMRGDRTAASAPVGAPACDYQGDGVAERCKRRGPQSDTDQRSKRSPDTYFLGDLGTRFFFFFKLLEPLFSHLQNEHHKMLSTRPQYIYFPDESTELSELHEI